MANQIGKSLLQGLEPIIGSLITITKESLKKPLAVQPEAVLAYELLLHLGYFAVVITTLSLGLTVPVTVAFSFKP